MDSKYIPDDNRHVSEVLEHIARLHESQIDEIYKEIRFWKKPITTDETIKALAHSILERIEQPGHLSYKESHDKMRTLLEDVEQICLDIVYEQSNVFEN